MAILPSSSCKARTKKEENPLFVGITNRDELRRDLLECSKSILESLKDYENFKSLREEKIRMVYKLKGELKEISRFINKLRTNLPKVKEVGIKKLEVKKAKAEKHKMVRVEEPKGKTEIERLEEELNEIENKLNSLS